MAGQMALAASRRKRDCQSAGRSPKGRRKRRSGAVAKISVSKAWDETREVLRRSSKLIIPVALAFVVLPGVIAELVVSDAQASGDTTVMPIVMLLFLLCSLVAQMAIQAIALPTGQTTLGAVIALTLRRLPVVVAAAILLIIPLIVLLSILFGVQLAAAAGGSVNPRFLGTLMIVLLVLLVPLSKFSLLTPVAVKEPGGPIRLLQRAWSLSRGATLKLYGLVVLTVLLPLLLAFIATAVFGSLVVILAGQPQGWSVSTLLVALVSQLASVAASVPLSILFARIYAQQSGPAHADVSVPSSGT
jgi:hypothetical protein